MLFYRTLSISLKMFHTEFFKGKSLQEVNGCSMEGAVLNIIIDGELDERERERECLYVCISNL